MRDRAGKVGANGIAPLLEQLQGDGRRIHLVGHSFGARAATAAANATNAPVHALVLLQGAFSHYGFADNWDGQGADGLFRAVPNRIHGPVVVTHTKNDKAVGLAYAIASRLAKQVAIDIGGPGDRYGGIGRNGALKTPEALAPSTLQPVGGTLRVRAKTTQQPAGRQLHIRTLRGDREGSGVRPSQRDGVSGRLELSRQVPLPEIGREHVVLVHVGASQADTRV